MSDEKQFFYNTATGQVEETSNRGQSKDLLGPYPTHEAAAAALESAHKRTEEWGRGGTAAGRTATDRALPVAVTGR